MMALAVIVMQCIKVVEAADGGDGDAVIGNGGDGDGDGNGGDDNGGGNVDVSGGEYGDSCIIFVISTAQTYHLRQATRQVGQHRIVPTVHEPTEKNAVDATLATTAPLNCFVHNVDGRHCSQILNDYGRRWLRMVDCQCHPQTDERHFGDGGVDRAMSRRESFGE